MIHVLKTSPVICHAAIFIIVSFSLTVHDEKPDGSGSRQRRQTQDRDERLRRGRRTLDDRALKKANAKKMTQKISFKRIAAEDGSDGDESDNEKKNASRKKKQRIEPPVSSNPLPIADRLQLMVSRARKGIVVGFIY